MTCKPRQISGNDPLSAISKDYNRYCDMISGNEIPGGGPAPSPVSPADLANLVRWHKADGVLYKDAAGADLVDTNLDPIGNWQDESVIGNHITQPTTANKMVWGSAKPLVNSNSPSIGYATGGQAYMQQGNKSTVCFSAKQLGTAGSFPYSEGLNVGNNRSINISMETTRTRIIFTGGGITNASFTDLPFTAGTERIVFITFDGVARNVNAYTYTGGVLVASSLNPINIPTANWSLTLPTGGIGARLFEVANPGSDADFYEMFQTSDIMSVADMTTQGAALATKWEIS